MNFRSSLRRTGSAATVVVAGLATVVQAAGPATAAGSSLRTERVNVSGTGAQADSNATLSDLSADGRYVVFSSDASTLVPGDTNAHTDIFLRDRVTNTTTLLSVSKTGIQSNRESNFPKISANGRYVTFVSGATNLVPGPQAGFANQVYLLDRETGALDRISETPDGKPSDGSNLELSISADGRYVTFTTYAGNLIPGVLDENTWFTDVVLYDRTTQKLSLVSAAMDGTPAGNSDNASISDSGRYVAFSSLSHDLVPDDTNNVGDIFVRDLAAGTTVRASLSDDDFEIPIESSDGQVSDDGRYVTFWSNDWHLVRGDTNFDTDVFVRDLQAGTTRLVSTSSDGVQGKSGSKQPKLTSDGRYVVFTSFATNLAAGDTRNNWDVFRKDLRTGTTTLVSRNNSGAQGDANSFTEAVTPNGEFVTYTSYATNLVVGDTNEKGDVFITELPTELS